MNKFEIILSDEAMQQMQKAKDINEKLNNGVYQSWENFIRSSAIIRSNQIIESYEKAKS